MVGNGANPEVLFAVLTGGGTVLGFVVFAEGTLGFVGAVLRGGPAEVTFTVFVFGDTGFEFGGCVNETGGTFCVVFVRACCGGGGGGGCTELGCGKFGGGIGRSGGAVTDVPLTTPKGFDALVGIGGGGGELLAPSDNPLTLPKLLSKPTSPEPNVFLGFGLLCRSVYFGSEF